MRSGHGFCAIDDSDSEDEIPITKPSSKVAIITDPTGELTPNGSVCGHSRSGSGSSSGELTQTLSALQRLSAEEQTTLGRKLGSGPISSRSKFASTTPTTSSVPEGGEMGPADSPFRVVLQNAVVQGDVDASAAALRSGADPNERDELRHSSLHFAAAKGDVACLKELMQSGARANVANNVS